MTTMLSTIRLPLGTFFSFNATDTSFSDLHTQPANSFTSKRFKKFFKKSPYFPFAVVIVVVVIIGVVVFKSLAGHASSTVLGSNATAPQAVVDKPKAQQTLNKEFLFPIKDDSGKEVSKIKYEVQNVELRDTIIIKGEQATSVQGRTFLILNLKITNSYQKSIQINARDYVRLSVNGSDEKLAPDIHNDPVEVQAISTKYTRVGFPINTTDKNLILQIGEIAGTKQSIKLELK